MHTRNSLALAALLSLALSACGGGSSSSSSSTGGATTLMPPAAALVQVSGTSPYATGCGGEARGSKLYEQAEVEPYLAINPGNPSNLIGAWQQDRFSDGGAHGLVAASSMDGGKHWKEHVLPFSVCGGGTSANGGHYSRASDPWVSFAPDGSAYVIAISFTGNTLQAGSSGGVLVSRSTDGGLSWSDPTALKTDGASAFNDKESITADPNDAHFVYAVWDRLTVDDHGATMFARTIDGGTTWQPAVAIYDPGVGNQTIGNEIVVTPDDTVIDVFEELDGTSAATASARVRLVRSTDNGATWSAPITVAENLAVGASDPNTGDPIRSGAGLPQAAAGPGGTLAVVWEDGRFSDGNHDDIAYASSQDDGTHWTMDPVQINSVPVTQAFTPSVAILADSTIGVTYFDFRNDPSTQDAGGIKTLPTDYWFTSSRDGVHWSEQHITGPFDLQQAPDAEGLFVGDYQVLGKVGSVFVPFFAQVDSRPTGPTDAFYLPPQPKPLTATRRVSHVARAMTTAAPGDAFRRRVHENIMRVLRDEDPVWDAIRAQRQSQTRPP